MTKPRSEQICLDTSRYYHCTTRCVRRGFLCGFDHHTNSNYEHRRAWLEQRLQQVASVYCIKVCSYAIMHNHYHATVFVNKEQALTLSDLQVIERWKCLYQLPAIIKRRYAGEPLTKAEHSLVQSIIAEWRERLYDLGWFMKEVNLYMARKANKEDDCTGHFWESRFKSQMLPDKKGLLSAMVYDELNPVRAGMAETPEESEFISLKARISEWRTGKIALPCLHPFMDSIDDQESPHIPFNLVDYIELVDWTGRQMRADKKGAIDNDLPPILQRLNLSLSDWQQVTTQLERPRATIIGTKRNVKAISIKNGRTRASGYGLPD